MICITFSTNMVIRNRETGIKATIVKVTKNNIEIFFDDLPSIVAAYGSGNILIDNLYNTITILTPKKYKEWEVV